MTEGGGANRAWPGVVTILPKIQSAPVDEESFVLDQISRIRQCRKIRALANR